jgi:hypothetical protein
MMLHEVEKRAISSTQRLLQLGLARAWPRRTPRGLSVCLYGAADDALCAGEVPQELSALRYGSRLALGIFEALRRDGKRAIAKYPFMSLEISCDASVTP